jgi:hypothetical protein
MSSVFRRRGAVTGLSTVCAGSVVPVFNGSLRATVLAQVVVWSILTILRCQLRRPALLDVHEYHWAVRTAARLLPEGRAAEFAEELQGHLNDMECTRRLTLNILLNIPPLMIAVWWGELDDRRDNRRATALLLLTARLRLLLNPTAPEGILVTAGVFERLQLLHAIGVDRAIGRLPMRAVPALCLARQFLRLRRPEVHDIQVTISALLGARHEAHLVARQLRRDPVASIRGTVEPYAGLRTREQELRTHAITLAMTLRDQLASLLASRRPLARPSRRRRRK